MGCCHAYFTANKDGDDAFTIDASRATFGSGCLKEAGERAKALGMTRVALFTDRVVGALEHVAVVKQSLRDAGLDVALYDEVTAEPTDESFQAAAAFATEGRFDGFVSVGGGSTMDTCKAANAYSSYPADFLAYVNAPIGDARPIAGPLKPHIACPTTAGTGSECTGIAVFDYTPMRAKTGMQYSAMKPTQALIDPDVTRTLPPTIVASSGFDAMSHALETLTARAYSSRPRPADPAQRPVSQGANPFSDIAAREALSLIGRYLVRAVNDASDIEARTEMMYAATLAGIAFGNCGCHIPHGMSYSVSVRLHDYNVPDYKNQNGPFIPHGMSVVLNAPSVYRFTAAAAPERHLMGAESLGADVRGATPQDAGEVLAARIIGMMQATCFPNGLSAVGFGAADIDTLVEGAYPQRRVLDNAPCDVTRDDLRHLYSAAMTYW
jgi:alcohol dehydrogenase class IV